MDRVIRLTNGERWDFNGLALRFDREFTDGILHFIVERTHAHFQVEDAEGYLAAPTWEWLIKHLALGQLRRVSERNGQSAIRALAERREYDPEAVREMDPKAALRAFVLRGLDKMGSPPRSDAEISHAVAELWLANPQQAAEFQGKPAPRTVRRWLDQRGTPGERLLRQMVSMSGRGPRRRRFPDETLRMMRRFAAWYWTRLGWSMADAYARFATLLIYINSRRSAHPYLPQLKRPSRQTFEKEVRRQECYETYKTRFGEKRAKQRFIASGIGLSADRFLRLGCMDHSILDNVAVFDSDWMLPIGRPTVTILIDVCTRCIVGFLVSFEPPSLYSVTECIRRANRPKVGASKLHQKYPVLDLIFGRFDEIIVDNGKEFTGTSLEDGMADVGTSIRFAPIATPTYKALAERFFGTLNSLIAHKAPGASLPTAFMREMGYDPAKDAALTLDQIENLIWEALSFYHINEHTGIGAPPAQLWQRDIKAHGIDFIDDDRLLGKMLGKVKYPCRVNRSGVELFGLQFHDPVKVGRLLEDLAMSVPKRGQAKGSVSATVKIKYNPADLSEIHVWNLRRKLYVTLPCLDEKYAKGISLWHHKKIQEWAKSRGYEFSTEEDRLKARAALIDRVYEAAPNLKGQNLRDMRRLLNSPKIQDPSGNAMIAYAPARHDGLAPIIPYDTLAEHRTDGGQKGSRPARPPKAKVRPQSKKAAKQVQAPATKAGFEDDVLIDLSGWKEIDL